jgi:hypothetical protein
MGKFAGLTGQVMGGGIPQEQLFGMADSGLTITLVEPFGKTAQWASRFSPRL